MGRHANSIYLSWMKCRGQGTRGSVPRHGGGPTERRERAFTRWRRDCELPHTSDHFGNYRYIVTHWRERGFTIMKGGLSFGSAVGVSWSWD